MTDGYTWQCPAELLALVDDLATECQRTREDILPMMLVNGLLWTVTVALQIGASANHDLLRRIQEAAVALPTDAPHLDQVLDLIPTLN